RLPDPARAGSHGAPAGERTAGKRVRERSVPRGRTRRLSRRRPSVLGVRLAAQSQFLHDLAVTVDLGGLQVVEQPTTLAHHAQQPATRGMVALVNLEVLGEVADLLGEKGDLDLGRA